MILGDLGESVKIRKIVTKIFFEIMLNKVVKSCKKIIFTHVKLEIQCKTGV